MAEREGDQCQICHTVLTKVKRIDHRSEEAKKKWPLTKEEKYILNCRCLHTGDLIIGGFF